MVEAAKDIVGLKLLALLSRRMGIHDLPKPLNFIIMGFNQDICYEGILMLFLGSLRSIERLIKEMCRTSFLFALPYMNAVQEK